MKTFSTASALKLIPGKRSCSFQLFIPLSVRTLPCRKIFQENIQTWQIPCKKRRSWNSYWYFHCWTMSLPFWKILPSLSSSPRVPKRKMCVHSEECCYLTCEKDLWPCPGIKTVGKYAVNVVQSERIDSIPWDSIVLAQKAGQLERSPLSGLHQTQPSKQRYGKAIEDLTNMTYLTKIAHGQHWREVSWNFKLLVQ